MVSNFQKTDKLYVDTNLSQNQSRMYIALLDGVTELQDRGWSSNAEYVTEINFGKYQIKETDMRVKTMNFTSPQKIDLSTGQYAVLITSPFHENFSGLVLNEELDEKTGMYTYQCQDWSRKYQTKYNFNAVNYRLYDIIRSLITMGAVPMDNPTKEQLNEWSWELSGLRPEYDYNQQDWTSSTYKTNPMTSSPNFLVRDKKIMDIIRDIIYANMGAYVEVYFNDVGIMQIEPYNQKDYKENILMIDERECSDISFKFDTTNIITGAYVRNSDDPNDFGEYYGNSVLRSIFGFMNASFSNKIDTGENNVKSTNGGKTGDVWGNKKTIWINADNGSGNAKNAIANILKQKGWSVHVGGTCSNCHYADYSNVTSDYQVYATVYNGFCAGTVREAYSSSIQNKLKAKGVTLVIMWDSSGWTNPQGMAPYKYGDFTGYNAGRAWDDNFSSSDPSINNVSKWLKDKGAIYCVSPTAEGIVEQFLAGGYFKYKGL